MGEELGALVRSARRNAELTREGLAERSMLSVRTIADIEARRQLRPRRDTLEAILLALAPAQEVRSAIRAAWRALAPSDEIPVLLDPFFGRFVELERIASLLTRERLVTLTGLAGVGKTRLALEALRTPLSRFDRVAFIPLAGASADGDVAPITLARLGGDSRGDLGRSLSAALRGSRPLVILDSAEHVRGGTIELVRRLLELESATVVVTSQVPLGLPGEHLVIVEPLPASDALALLVERAERAGAQVDPSDRVLTDICARLDGLPLAIELAAPKLRTLDAGALLRRLSESDADSLVLTDDMTHRRYRTLSDAIAWNYAQLSGEEQRVLRALATFAGTWSSHGAEDLCGSQVIPTLDRLVAANFITRLESQNGQARYWVLSTIRGHARSKVDEREAEMLARAHVRCVARLVRRHAVAYESPTEPLSVIDDRVAEVIDACLEDIVIAADMAVASGALTEAIDIVCGIYRYWQRRGYATWATRHLRDIFAHLKDAPEEPGRIVIALRVYITLNAVSADADADTLRTAAEKTVQLASEAGDDETACTSALSMMQAAVFRGDADSAIRYGQRGLELARRLERRYDFALSLGVIGYAFEGLGKMRDALASSRRALRAFEGIGDSDGSMSILSAIAAQAAALGKTRESRQAALRALRLRSRCAMPEVSSTVLRRIAEATILLGRPKRAAFFAILAAREIYDSDVASEIANVAEAFGRAVQSFSQASSTAAMSLSATRRVKVGCLPYPAVAARNTTLLERLRHELDPVAFESATDDSVTRSLRQIVEDFVEENRTVLR